MAATGAEGKVSVVTEQPAVSFAELEQPAVSFAELLKRLRTDAGLTQEDLAARAGVSPRAISDLERGINKTVRHGSSRVRDVCARIPRR